jgi:hypothetical protein
MFGRRGCNFGALCLLSPQQTPAIPASKTIQEETLTYTHRAILPSVAMAYTSRNALTCILWYNARPKVGVILFWGRKGDSALTRSSVREDWCACLPAEKSRVFDSIVHQWEDAYAVFSVPLDDAMALRAEGQLRHARQLVEIAAAVVTDLTAPLAASCHALEKWGRQLVVPPAVASLNPSFFRSEAARQNAQWNQLMHRILFGSRSRFLHKLRALEMNVSALGDEFHRQAEELSAGVHIRPDATWPRLDELHYDVNTCLRETIVVLKSFILALPPKNLSLFHGDLNAAASAARQAFRPAVSRVLG